MPYSLKIALQSLWHEKWINLLSMLTIAMGLLVITLMVSTVYNINLFAKKLPERFFVVAYLGDRVNEQQAQDIITSLKERSGIER